MYNYVGILNRSSAVTKALTCNFLNTSSKLNLVIAKTNIIEIYNISTNGIELTPSLNIYGNIIILEKILNNETDNLLLITEDLDFSILGYNKSKNEIATLDKGSIKEEIGKKQEKVYCALDKNFEYAVVSAYKNIFKIIFLKSKTRNNDFTVRYEYDDLLDLIPLNIFNYNFDNDQMEIDNNINNSNSNNSNNNIIMSSTNNTNNNISNFKNKIFNMPLKKEEKTIQYFALIKTISAQNLNKSSINYDNKSVNLDVFNIKSNKQEIFKETSLSLDLTTNPTITFMFSPKVGGLIIFYANHLKYYSILNGRFVEIKRVNFTDRKFLCHCEIDKNRYFLVDELGNLFLLAFKPEGNLDNFNGDMFMDDDSNDNNNNNNFNAKYSIVFQFLGEINYCSSLAYLDNNIIFAGSQEANSQLIKILKTPSKDVNRPFLEVIEEFDNLAPISDFVITSNGTEEANTEVLCLSGTGKACSLKTIRKGTSINVNGQLSLTNVENIFTVNMRANKDNNLIDINGSDYKLLFVR